MGEAIVCGIMKIIHKVQGERRFFRVCLKWLAKHNPELVKRNLKYIPEYGRYDDLYTFVGTPLERDAFVFIKNQLMLDMDCKTPSLLAKWLKSENTSSLESRKLGNLTREYLGMTHKQYRKVLSVLRTRINVLEKLMSENRWAEIEYDKIPSKAGLKYKNAFARRDIERVKAGVQTYEQFAKDETKTVNAKTLYPYEVVSKAINLGGRYYRSSMPAMDDTNRLMINKYWDNLSEYFNGASFNGIAVVDTSGSMVRSDVAAPINVAISLGLYCAEKAKGPFAGHYISFASRPQLIATEGVDFCDKVYRIYRTNLCDNTNIEATFDLILNLAINNKMKQEDLPANVIVISDMQIDYAVTTRRGWGETEMEAIRKKFESYGYKMPRLIYWNVDARENTILDNGPDVSFVSGMSPSIFETIMTGKTGYQLMMTKLDSERYKVIH